MGVTLYLVRHCESAVDPGSPRETWQLTARGAAQAERLVGLADAPVGAVLSGDEPKMVQTLQPLASAVGAEVEATETLRESHSEGWCTDDEFLAAVRRFLTDRSSAPAPGWESADDATGRFLATLDRVIARPDRRGDGVVVCSGGRVLTAVLHGLGVLAPEALFATWRGIGMPDVAIVELRNGGATLRSPFGSVALGQTVRPWT